MSLLININKTGVVLEGILGNAVCFMFITVRDGYRQKYRVTIKEIDTSMLY
jgi:hypothetical protein